MRPNSEQQHEMDRETIARRQQGGTWVPGTVGPLAKPLKCVDAYLSEPEGVYAPPDPKDLIRQAIVWSRVATKELQRELNGVPNEHNRAAAQLNTVLNAILYRNLGRGR